ncbi:MAG TPA: hypothetical protein VIJ42_09730 [Stellaceae bacterium]
MEEEHAHNSYGHHRDGSAGGVVGDAGIGGAELQSGQIRQLLAMRRLGEHAGLVADRLQPFPE